jgi:hypothetical protein
VSERVEGQEREREREREREGVSVEETREKRIERRV